MPIHMCPPPDSSITPCCRKHVLLDLPRDDQITTNPALVNCTFQDRVYTPYVERTSSQ